MASRSAFEALCVVLGIYCGALLAPVHAARTSEPIHIAAPDLGEVDAVGEIGTDGLPQKTLQDTVWIADWSFDAGSGCTSAGWVVWDNRILNVHNDAEFWHVDNRFAGQGGVIVNRAAILSKHDLCWAQDGYGNDNDFSIILKYSGAGATLTFDKASDSEPGFDFVNIECDSLGRSEWRANPSTNPTVTSPAAFRSDPLWSTDGFDPGSHIGPIGLVDYGPGTHEVYIRFFSDGGYSDEDGDYRTTFKAGLIVDNIVVTGGTAYTENFEGVLNPNVTLIETSLALPFLQAPWLRLFQRITDNDKCTENTTCAWLGTDPTRPAFFSDMAFGPGGAVIRNWLDDMVASPWVGLASTPSANQTILSFRRFGGNNYADGAIAQGWRVRSKSKVDNTDTPAPGDSVDCVTPWGHASQFNSLGSFQWLTASFDMTAFFTPKAAEIQVSFRTVDWQYISGPGSPAVLNTGPGPFWDRVRIGRRVAIGGPAIVEAIDSRTQAQDAFPTRVDASITPGQHHVPDGNNRFGSCAFSIGQDLGSRPGCTRYISGDSITLESVMDARGAGGVASVRFFGAITAGPHQGKVPGPFSTTGGFFVVNADSTRSSSGTLIANRWHVDLNDDYFRGGDVVKYFWAATDNAGGFSSTPAGLAALPTSVAQAEAATRGLHEVNYLPIIDWDPAYLLAVAGDPEGDVDPTPAQIAAATQKNCILYYQKLNSRRRSGDLNRTSFMFTLDELGYRGKYDVFDVQGYGNTANQLITRANVGQANGYSLIIQDDGRSNLVPNIPAGQDNDANQFDQAGWYRSYLAQGSIGLAGTATLWIIGENTAFLHRDYPLFTTDFGLSLGATDTEQGLTVNPLVHGHASNTFANGTVVTFTGEEFALNGGCPAIRAYDVADPTAGATQTHRYAVGATNGRGAIVMNRNAALRWNTVWMGFGWFDIRFSGAPTNPTPQSRLATKILSATIAAACSNPGGPDISPVNLPPARTELHANVPNPFNPTTRIAFDLAATGPVRLQLFDAAGRLVRTLVQAERPAGRYIETWTGIDDRGERVSSGVYFYRLEALAYQCTRKMVLLQ